MGFLVAQKKYALDAFDGTPANALYVDADGKVSIPLSDATLEVDASGATSNPAQIKLRADRASASAVSGRLMFFNNGATAIAEILGIRGTSDTSGDLAFFTTNVRRITIDEAGNTGFKTSNPATLVELADDETITGNVTDDYSAGLTLDPEYSADSADTYTITRHNYIDVNNVAAVNDGAGALNVTDACLVRLDADLGTHKVTTNLDKSSNTAAGTVKVNVNGTIYHIQLYADS